MGAAGGLLLAGPVRVERTTRRGCGSALARAGCSSASIVGADALHAWIGTPDRRLGWIAWCTFPLLFLCGQAITTERDRRVVMRGASIAAAFLGGWCVVERAGLVADRRDVRGPSRRRTVRATRVRRRGRGAARCRWRRASRSTAARRARWRVVGGVRRGRRGRGAVVVADARRVARRRRRAGAARRAPRRGRAAAVARDRARVAAAVVVLFAVTPLGGRVADAFDLGHGHDAGAVRRLVGRRARGRAPSRCSASGPRATGSCSRRSSPRATCGGTAPTVIPDRAHNGIIDVAVDGGVVAGLLYAALLAVLRRGRVAVAARHAIR